MNLTVKDILFFQNKVAYTRDEQAYKRLFFHFYPSLHRFANGIVRNSEVAEEIVSDTLMKVWDAGSKLAQIEKLNLYLFTAVKNACLTHLAKRKLEILSLDEVEDTDVIAASNGQTPQTQLEVSEIEIKIEEAIKALPPQCGMVYRLIKEEGFSYKEVTAILDISQNTIETHMRIALKRIRLLLSQYLSEKRK